MVRHHLRAAHRQWPDRWPVAAAAAWQIRNLRPRYHRGAVISQWDMSFFKTFPVTERCRIQFRAESFNFANHTNLANPNSCVDCPGVAGRIFGAFSNYVPRQWQFALKVEY